MNARRRRFVRVEDLVGRRVRDARGRSVGRIEEIRAERRADGTHEVVEYHLGTAALLERLAIVRRLLGRTPQMLVVRWDQLDLRHPEAPVLTCAAGELERR
jgi:hypothetical protein